MCNAKPKLDFCLFKKSMRYLIYFATVVFIILTQNTGFQLNFISMVSIVKMHFRNILKKLTELQMSVVFFLQRNWII